MDTGEWLGLILLVFFTIWGAADAIIWHKGKQTFSQWVIRQSRKRKYFALFAFAVITGLWFWLIDHFELIEIINEHWKE